jgi:hypothetical protein
MPVILLVAFLAVGWTVTGLLFVFRIRGLREMNDFLGQAQAEAQDLRVEAERARMIAETECQYMKVTLANVLQRPAVAVITEDHIQSFASIVHGIINPEKKMN